MPARGWVESQSLNPGDVIETDTFSAAVVISLNDLHRREATYNFTVDEFHSYHVSQDRGLVHNQDENRKKKYKCVGSGNGEVTKGLAGLSRGQMKTALQSAQAAKKGSTVVSHALSKHAGRNPKIWGKMTGPMKTWNDQAMKHFREIVRGPGDFKKTTSNGKDFLE